METIPEEFDERDEKRRKELLSEGFGKWTKKDFSKFIKACELYGMQNIESISKLMKTKYEELGLKVKLVVQPGGGHSSWPGVMDQYPEIWTWFKTHLQ